jgi:formate/nitrite transporter FocA (FNT family)
VAEPGDIEGIELTENEKQEVETRKHPRAQVLYEAIRLEGEHELGRPVAALAWSGLAAGLSMGFSLMTMGLLRAALPTAPWAKLVVSLGYCVGFMVVIVGRQQLFTENTVTPVIPLLQNKDRRTLLALLRLWAIVLFSNLLGTLIFAFVICRTDIFSPEVKDAFARLGQQTLEGGFRSHFLRAVFSGWLIALMVWMLAGATSRAFIVVAITYIIGVGDLSHVVAGSSEALYAVFNGDASMLDYLARFLAPVGLGNMLGGIALVALLSHAQIIADVKG